MVFPLDFISGMTNNYFILFSSTPLFLRVFISFSNLTYATSPKIPPTIANTSYILSPINNYLILFIFFENLNFGFNKGLIPLNLFSFNMVGPE